MWEREGGGGEEGRNGGDGGGGREGLSEIYLSSSKFRYYMY